MQYFQKILYRIFPPKCLSCGKFESDYNNLCAVCWKNIVFISAPNCNICGYIFEISGVDICASCTVNPPIYKKSISCLIYNEFSKKLITDFKYHDKTQNAIFFAKILDNYIKDLNKNIDYIIPVPSHRLKILKRNYNQVNLMAFKLKTCAKIPVKTNILLKTKITPEQTSLSRRARLKNLKNSFDINPKFKDKIAGKIILLLDDVLTTGSTVNECCKILSKYNVSEIYVATLARGRS